MEKTDKFDKIFGEVRDFALNKIDEFEAEKDAEGLEMFLFIMQNLSNELVDGLEESKKIQCLITAILLGEEKDAELLEGLSPDALEFITSMEKKVKEDKQSL